MERIDNLAIVGYLALAAALLLVLGVVLPAVWSSRPDRRRDARAVLRLILHSVRPVRGSRAEISCTRHHQSDLGALCDVVDQVMRLLATAAR